jgi:hypothetical protein
MTKRIVLLVAVLSVVIAPNLMASWCYRCKVVPAPEVSYCIEHTSTAFLGWKMCTSDSTGCFTSGDRCYGQPTQQSSTPLAADYAVASVERLDEPQTAGAATLVTDATPAER